MSTTARKPAPRLARPAARYWKGKVPKGADEVEDSDSEDEQEPPEYEEDVPIEGDQDFAAEENVKPPIRAAVKTSVTKAINVTLKDVNISAEGKVIVAGREESGRTALEESEEESSEEEDSRPHKLTKEGDESSEYESSSEEDEEQPKVLFRPKFVPKRGRVTITERETLSQDTEEALKKKEQEAEERRKQSHNMVAESIKRELAEKEKEEEIPDVDDTDGIDPDAEFEAWRLRELARIKRDKEEELRIELEREEIERRRALPEEQRLKEDMERAKKSRDQKPKGQQQFLQKYWHKGAFHQDEEILRRHDFTERTESTIDVSVLPQVMQVKNFGKRGRTKYTHLVDQDTTAGTGGFGGIKALGKPGGVPTNPGAGCFLCGGPHMKKDCPQNREGSGPNSAPLGPRDRPRQSWRDDDGKQYGSREVPRNGYSRDRERDDNYRSRPRERYRRSRSRSPRRRQDAEDDTRKGVRHSRERSTDSSHVEKRRRIEY